MARADHISAVEALVRDTSGLFTPADVDRALDQAVLRYGLDRPRVLGRLVTVPAEAPFAVALPAEWSAASSMVRLMEYPLDQVPAARLPATQWRLTATGFVFAAELAGKSLMVAFTAPHQVDDATDSIPAPHAEAVQAYGAAQLLRQLAASTAGDEATTLQADAVAHGSKSSRYAARARELQAIYDAVVRLDVATGGFVSASASADAPTRFPRLLR